METRIGFVGIVIENMESVDRVNSALHDYSEIIIGRMGVPYRQKGISVIALIVDGLADDISAMTGKLGKISGVSVKTSFAKQ